MRKKRPIWRGLWSLALFVASLTACGGAPAEAPDQSQGQEPPVQEASEPWRAAYKAFLADLCKQEAAVRNIDRPDYDPNEYQAELSQLSYGYFLYDMEEDGIPELFLQKGFYMTEVYTYQENDVSLLGPIETWHTSLYSDPKKAGVICTSGHSGYYSVERLTFSSGEPVREPIFEKTSINDPYPDMADIVPGSKYLRIAPTTLGLTYGEEFDAEADTPLTLPIDDYGRDRTPQAIDPARDEAARAAIQAVLDGEAPLTGVSADGFGGNTGEMTLSEYLAPGGVDKYADTPQTVEKLSWLDLNGDGQRECLLRLRDSEGWPDQYVILAEQAGTVYAYCVNYSGDSDVSTEGVFCDEQMGAEYAFAVSFDREQAYLYTVDADASVPETEWIEP